MEQANEDGSASGSLALKLMGDLGNTISGIQLGITIASLVLGFVAEPAVVAALERLLGRWINLSEGPNHTAAVAFSFALVSFLHILIGEMVPKNFALAAPERTVLLLARPTSGFISLFRPVIWALTAIGNLGARMFGVDPKDSLDESHGSGDLAVVVRQSAAEGFLDPSDTELVTGALGFGDLTVGEIMTKRDAVVSLPRWSSVAEVEALMVGTGHSRIPITGAGGLDSAIGFVHAKSLLTLPTEAQQGMLPDHTLADLLVFGPERPIDEVLLAMQVNRRHIGLVETADGSVVGLITLEDVIEELVGDLLDESDGGRRFSQRRVGEVQSTR